MWRLAFVVGLIVLGVAPSGVTASPTPTASFAFTTFDAPFPGATNTEAIGLNNLGTSVGDYCDATGNLCHGFKRSAKGVFTSSDAPSTFGSTTAFGINTTGVIVGQFFFAGRHCFVLDANGFTQIDVPGVITSDGLGTGCRGINDQGQIVGITVTKDPTTGARHRHGFLLSGGVFTSFDAPVAGTTQTVMRGINNAGQIAGRYVVNGVNHGFLLDGTSFTTIDFPGAKETDAEGINNRGQIVGTYRDSNDFLFGYTMTMDAPQGSQGGSPSPTFTQIVVPGVVQNVAGVVDFAGSLDFFAGVAAINDRGQITGEYLGFDGNFHGFVTAPRQDFEVTASALVPSANPTVITGVFEGDPIGEGSFTLNMLSNPTAAIQWELFAFCGWFQPNLVLTSNTGDQIFVDLLVTTCQTAPTAFEHVPSTGVISGIYRIIGGTRQFGGASGSGFVTGTFAMPAVPSPLTPATLTVTLEGTISR